MDKKCLLRLIHTSTIWKNGKQIPSGTSKLSDDIKGISQASIWNYIQCLYLEDDTQEMIGKEF